MPPLSLTDHAIDRFIARWRPNLAITEASDELLFLAQHATATRRRTRTGDAQLYISESTLGERIALAVRDNVIVTVLPPEAETGEKKEFAVVLDRDALQDSQDTVAACQALLAEDAQRKQEADNHRRQAETTLRRWKVEGKKYTHEVLRSAHEVLGLVYEVAPPPVASVLGDPSSEAEFSRRVNATLLIKEWQAGRDHSMKALRKAHATLEIPFTPEAKTPEEEARLAAARRLVKEWEAGRSIASPKAARRAYALLWKVFVPHRQRVGIK